MTLHTKWTSLLVGALTFSTSFLSAETTQEKVISSSTFEQSLKSFPSSIAKTAIPATVFIKTTLMTPFQDGQEQFFDFYKDDLFQRFFGPNPFRKQQQPPLKEQTSCGSGFFISSDGYIVTNYHVIKDAKEITVVLNDGRELSATVKGSDPKTDLAILHVEGKEFPFLRFGDSDKLEIGAWVVAIGNPFALRSSLSVGIVSGKGRQDLGLATFEDFIQTDAVIGPGNSGGALLDTDGNVIGVNTAIMLYLGGYTGNGFAIPSKMAQHIANQIIQGGTVTRAYLGILLQPVDKQLAEAISLKKQEGVLISDIVKGSPAEKAGLKQGDIILSYNGEPVTTLSQFRNDIAMMVPESIVNISILRGGKTIEIPVSMGLQTETGILSATVMQKLGLKVENLSSELLTQLGYSSDINGVIITRVNPGSIAAAAGLTPSSIITGVATDWNNQQKVRNTEDFEKAIESFGDKDYIILIVRQQNYQRYYPLKLN